MVVTPLTSPQIRPVKRTLCIGIGGTGRDTLMRLRRFVVEHHGTLKNLPVVSFLAIDTDEGSLNTTGFRGETYRGQRLTFDPNEKVPITMNAQEVGELVKEFSHESYGESPFSHIEEWFPPALKDAVKVISGGANGIRPIGRLGFFHNFQKIKQSIQDAANRTVGHEQRMLEQNFSVQPGLDIFVVGSLCGGTGSGIFLDLAYTLRYLFKNNTNTFSYLVISPDIYPNDSAMQAGVYAALKELNHYTNDGTTFKACYDKNNQIYVSENKPPFDYPYLVSSQTTVDHKILRKEELCNVIAYKIYLDIASELRTKLRANRNNIEPRMREVDLHPFMMSQYYMTFGLSSIYFSRDRLLDITLNRLQIKLLNFWLMGYGQAPDAKDLLDRFLGKLNAQGQSNFFVDRISELVQENGKNYYQYLATWKNRNQNSNIEDENELEELKQFLPNRFKSAFREVQPGLTDNIRGKWLTSIKINSPRVQEQLQDSLDVFLGELLDADNTNFSLYNALSFLEAIRTKLDQYQYDLEDKKQDIGTMKKQEDLDEIWNEAEAEIDSIKPKGFIPWSKKRDYQTIQNITDKAVTEIAKLLKHNYELFALDESIRIVESLKEYVSLRLNQITNLDTFIKRLLQYYRQQDNEIKATKVEEIPGEAIFPEEEIDRLVPPNSSRDKLASNTNEVAKELNFSLFELAATNHFAEDSIKVSVKNVLERNFVIEDVDQMQSVAKRFMINYNPTQQAIALENVAKKSEPLLDIFKNDPLFLGAVESVTIGFKTSDSTGDDPLRKILTDQLGIPNIAITPIQTDNEILFVKEYGGFPLRLINHLQQLKRVYDNQKSFGKLHNHGYIQFDDIIPVEARIIENLEYILYPCLALNVLSENSQNPQYYEFACYDSLRDEYYSAELSNDWRIALEQLVERPDMSEILTQLLRDEENKIISNPTLWQSKYRPHISAFINYVDKLKEGDRNFILKTKVIGQRATVNNSAKEGVIPRYIKSLETKIKAGQIALSPSIDINQKNLPIFSDPDLD